MVQTLDEATLNQIEREHSEGLTSHQILEIFQATHEKLSEATLRKYVQLGLLPRSIRVGRKGKHQGSQGMYPASVVRQVVRIREMMARDYTIEQIQREFFFVRGDIEELQRTLSTIFLALDKAAQPSANEATGRVIASELHMARKMAQELVEKLNAIESRMISRAHIARAAG
jgi:hypothetical protein